MPKMLYIFVHGREARASTRIWLSEAKPYLNLVKNNFAEGVMNFLLQLNLES